MLLSILVLKTCTISTKKLDKRIDTLIEKFSNYTGLKVSIIFAENGMKWDLYKEETKPDGIIVQYLNHFECAIPREIIDQKNQ
jgi:hypothetical protein